MLLEVNNLKELKLLLSLYRGLQCLTAHCFGVANCKTVACLRPAKPPMTICKDGQHDNSPKVKPKHLDHPLVTGCCSKGPVHVGRQELVSFIYGCSEQADICSSVHLSYV